jgi:hypothetical protein
MGNTGRNPHPRGIAPTQRSTVKAPSASKLKKAVKKTPRLEGGPNNGTAAKAPYPSKLAVTMETQGYLADDSEEEFMKKTKGKRRRNRDQRGRCCQPLMFLRQIGDL